MKENARAREVDLGWMSINNNELLPPNNYPKFINSADLVRSSPTIRQNNLRAP